MLEHFHFDNLSRHYCFRSPELARDKKRRQQQCVMVMFLDDTTCTFHIDVSFENLHIFLLLGTN